ncbi:MAG TPA: cytochrome c oxidase subunit II [Acidimicrobiales bacterium]|nr:cytochrome c oxidase subunit II [Acidimicrobiales bacterium]
MSTGRRRRVLGSAAAALALLAAACSHNAPNALAPKGPGAERIAGVWWLMFGLATAVYVVVAGLIIAAAMRGRRLPEGEERPSRIKDSGFIWFGGVVAPAVILGGLAVVTVTTTNDLRRVEAGALRIEVTGYRWWWDVRYPDDGVVTANEIHIPVGQPVEIGLESADVIHSFWVPELAGKVDQIPGQRNVIRLRADEPGTYRGFCAEFCGLQHAKMQFLVIADPPDEFARWITRRQRPVGGPSSEQAALGQVVFNRSTCGACHAVRGTDARGTTGPDLSDLGSRTTIGAVSIDNDAENLAEWIRNPHESKPGNLMPPTYLPPEELAALVAYLEGLE